MDVYLFCTDGLCGMPQAIEAVYPKSRLQRCIVHQIRSSTRYVNYKDMKQLIALMPWAPDIQQDHKIPNSDAYTKCYLD